MNLPKRSPWDRYHRWRIAMWISVPTFFVIGKLASPLPNEFGVLLASIPAFVSLFALQLFKCPRCGKTFFHEGIWWQPWVTTCLHCGLPKWKEADYVNPDSGRLAYQNRSIAEMAADSAIPALERNSRFLTLVLRDDPGAIHLNLDSDGWADVANLLTRANRYGFKLTRADLADLPAVPECHRFEWDQPGNRIRWRES